MSKLGDFYFLESFCGWRLLARNDVALRVLYLSFYISLVVSCAGLDDSRQYIKGQKYEKAIQQLTSTINSPLTKKMEEIEAYILLGDTYLKLRNFKLSREAFYKADLLIDVKIDRILADERLVRLKLVVLRSDAEQKRRRALLANSLDGSAKSVSNSLSYYGDRHHEVWGLERSLKEMNNDMKKLHIFRNRIKTDIK